MTDGVVQSVFAHIENPSPEVKAVMERLDRGLRSSDRGRSC